MVLSMTGFGRGEAEDARRKINVEVKAVNHRYLDIHMHMPRCMSMLEEIAKKQIQQVVARGRVDVTVGYENKAQDQITVSVNEPVANAYQNAFQELAEKFDIEDSVDLATLAGIEDIFTVTEAGEDEDALRALLVSALDLALQALTRMREKEGQFLMEDLRNRSVVILEMVDAIEDRSPLMVEEYRKKLEQHLKELLSSSDLEETRFNTEVAYFADRSSITEEIIRLRSHIGQLRQILKTGGPIGRKLDFLMQEMNREANTIGSKASDLFITNQVVSLKSEMEKIREQVQNLE